MTRAAVELCRVLPLLLLLPGACWSYNVVESVTGTLAADEARHYTVEAWSGVLVGESTSSLSPSPYLSLSPPATVTHTPPPLLLVSPPLLPTTATHPPPLSTCHPPSLSHLPSFLSPSCTADRGGRCRLVCLNSCRETRFQRPVLLFVWAGSHRHSNQ